MTKVNSARLLCFLLRLFVSLCLASAVSPLSPFMAPGTRLGMTKGKIMLIVLLSRELCKKPTPCTCKERKSMSVGSICVLGEPLLELLANPFILLLLLLLLLLLSQSNFSVLMFILFARKNANFCIIAIPGRSFSENGVHIGEI